MKESKGLKEGKAHAKEEMKILKKGGASPKMLKEEREEHKAEGFQAGGKVRHGKITHWSKGGKVKKYAEGGEVETDDGAFEEAGSGPRGYKESSENFSESKGEATPKASEQPAKAEKPEFKTFKEAYAWNKKNNGEGSTFDWQGKKILVKDKATPTETKPSRPISQKLGEDYAAADKMLRNQPKGTSADATAALTRLRDNAKATYEKAAASEKSGKSMVRLKSGGMVRSYGAKSHGKC